MCASKYKRGVVLIEMLMSLIVVSVIMLLLLSLMTEVTKMIDYQRIQSKLMQVSGLMIDDVLSAVNVDATSSCLLLEQTDDEITYCIEGDKMIRRVNGKGYERLLTSVDIKFQTGEIIYLQFMIGEKTSEIPLWSTN